jgi:hypothetical protein
MAAPTMTIPIQCPDCEQRVDAPVVLGDNGYVVRLGDAFEGEFIKHVMADPQIHPTFATRDDADSGQ